MTPLSECDHGCWWEGESLVRHHPKSAKSELRRSMNFGQTLSLSCPRELSPVLPKLRHREVHAVRVVAIGRLRWIRPAIDAGLLAYQTMPRAYRRVTFSMLRRQRVPP